MGKASVSIITVWSRSCRRPKSPCYAPFVGLGYPARDPSTSPLPVFLRWHRTALLAGTFLLTSPPASPLLLLTGWHPTARWLRSPLYRLRLSRCSSVTPRRGIALPQWLPPTPWLNDVITGASVEYSYSVGPHSSGFLLTRDHHPLPQARLSNP